MDMEEKMAERFAQETIRNHKKHNIFDLEDDESNAGLTHGGKALFDGEALQDDFDEDDLSSGDESDGSKAERRMLKRMRQGEGDEGEDEEGEDQPERKKSKAEVMQEVIAKSKEYKYLRQAAKEEDSELRYVQPPSICTCVRLTTELQERARQGASRVASTAQISEAQTEGRTSNRHGLRRREAVAGKGVRPQLEATRCR